LLPILADESLKFLSHDLANSLQKSITQNFASLIHRFFALIALRIDDLSLALILTIPISQKPILELAKPHNHQSII